MWVLVESLCLDRETHAHAIHELEPNTQLDLYTIRKDVQEQKTRSEKAGEGIPCSKETG